MATANDIIRRAMRVARVLAVGQNPSAADTQDCLTIFNQMLYAWAHHGINLNLPTLTSSDTVDVPDDVLMGLSYNLAMLIAPEYERPIDPVVAAIAMNEFNRLQRTYAYIPVVDLGLPRESSVAVDYA